MVLHVREVAGPTCIEHVMEAGSFVGPHLWRGTGTKGFVCGISRYAHNFFWWFFALRSHDSVGCPGPSIRFRKLTMWCRMLGTFVPSGRVVGRRNQIELGCVPTVPRGRIMWVFRRL